MKKISIIAVIILITIYIIKNSILYYKLLGRPIITEDYTKIIYKKNTYLPYTDTIGIDILSSEFSDINIKALRKTSITIIDRVFFGHWINELKNDNKDCIRLYTDSITLKNDIYCVTKFNIKDYIDNLK